MGGLQRRWAQSQRSRLVLRGSQCMAESQLSPFDLPNLSAAGSHSSVIIPVPQVLGVS